METTGGSGSRVPQGQGQGDEEARRAGMAGALTVSREYRRGNWTLPETMVLIEAKRKVHEERHPGPGEHGLARWRWVEDYCWRAGCRRSQNQCNDRWDNLMRDYKKVRAHELAAGAPSYWAMGRAERKERGLPSNLLREIYDAMTEVIERRTSVGCSGAGGAFLAPSSSAGPVHDAPMHAPPLAQISPRPLPLELPRCSPESPERKRRRPSLDETQPTAGKSSTPASAGTHFRHQEHGGHRHHEEADHSDASSDDDSDDEDAVLLSGAIGRCAAILSEALESREAAEERRHRELVAAEERRGRALQARREAGGQCAAGLAAAVAQLAGSMLALAAAKRKDDKGGGPGPAAPK